MSRKNVDFAQLESCEQKVGSGAGNDDDGVCEKFYLLPALSHKTSHFWLIIALTYINRFI